MKTWENLIRKALTT